MRTTTSSLRFSLPQFLLWIAAAMLIGSLAVINPYQNAPQNLALGSVLAVIALLPLSAWMAPGGERRIPLLAMHGLFYVVAYALGGFVKLPISLRGLAVAESDTTRALLAALCSWLMILAGYALGRRCRTVWALDLLSIDSPAMSRVVAVLLYPISVVVLVWARRSEQPEWQQVPEMVHMFLLLWVLHAAWSRQLAPTLRRAITLVAIPVEFVLFGLLAEGFLAGLLFYGLAFGITYAETRRRVPLALPIVVVVIFTVITPAKAEYRSTTWKTTGPRIGQLEGTMTFVQIAWDNLAKGSFGANRIDTIELVHARLVQLHTVAAVMADTPGIQPYRYGATLLPVLTKFIPRAIWPDKPREDLGNRWAHDYGYLDREDDATSYNLCWLAEMYMNGGWVGVALLSATVGLLMGWLWRWLLVTRSGSAHYAFAFMMAYGFFYPESNMSGGVGNLIPSAMMGLTIIAAMRPFSGQRAGALRRRSHARGSMALAAE